MGDLIPTERLEAALADIGTNYQKLSGDLAGQDQRLLLSEAAVIALAERPIALPPKRDDTLYVAAADSSALAQDRADLILGDGDEELLHRALPELAPGGAVKFASGSYAFDAPLMITTPCIRILGSGTGPRTGSFLPGMGTRIMGSMVIGNPAAADQLYGVEVADLTFDSSPGHALDVWACNSYIHHCHIHKAKKSGVRVWGRDKRHPYNTIVENCNIDFCDENGILWDNYAADQHAKGNVINDCKGAGIWVKAGGGQISQGQIYNNHDNLVLDGGAQVQAQDMKIENAWEFGVKLLATRVGPTYAMLTGIGLRFNGKSGKGLFPHIGGVGTKTVTSIFITDCRFNSVIEEQANLPSWAVDIWGKNCKDWKVTNNMFGQPVPEHFGQGTVNNRGTNCIAEIS